MKNIIRQCTIIIIDIYINYIKMLKMVSKKTTKT